MELGTFGAIFTFALELERQAVAFYESATAEALEEVFASLAESGHKRIRRLERTRREGVAEMILESITGLDRENYQVSLATDAAEAGLLKQAIEWETTARRFYLDASQKMPVREVARTFERLARENERRKVELEEA